MINIVVHAVAARHHQHAVQLAAWGRARVSQPEAPDSLVRGLQEPPPAREHEGLRKYHRERSGIPVTIGRDVREIVIRELAGKLRELGYLVVAVSVNGRHLHALVELPNDMGQIRQIVGKCKQRASHAVRDVMPGSIWAAGGEFKLIKDEEHYGNVFNYIRTKQGPTALVWSNLPEENWIDRAH